MHVNQFVKSISLDNVVDLSIATNKKEYSSIFSMVKDQSIVKEYVQEQFLDNASVYKEKYTNYDHFLKMISKSFSEIDILRTKNVKGLDKIINKDIPFRNRKLKILDIGSGSGNSIFPLIDLCSNSIVVATDLSIQLLQLIKEEAIRRNVSNLGYFQMNAEELNFKEKSFDLVVGASILHHLFSPNKTIEGCSKILKKGGFAVFYEPFEIGSVFIKVIFQELIDCSKSNELSEEVINFFKAIINDYEHRLGRDKTKDYYRYMDDKWLFTKAYFEELANKHGFSECHIYSSLKHSSLFEGQIKSLLFVGLGKTPEVLPNWAWEKIQEFDRCFSEDAKSEFITEGCIILQK